MSRFPDPRAPDPRLDALRQRTGQTQAPQQQPYPPQQPYPQQFQYPLQDYGQTQQPWPQETTQQQPYAPSQMSNTGYAANGQQSYHDDQAYGALSNGYGAADPYGQAYSAPQNDGYAFANGYAQQPQQRALPAPAPQTSPAQPLRPREQQATQGYPAQQASSGARLSRSLAQHTPSSQLTPAQHASSLSSQHTPVQHTTQQPFSGQSQLPQVTPAQPAAPSFAPYAPPQAYSQGPQTQLPQTQVPTTAGRRAGDANGQGYGGRQPRQDAQVAAFGGWQPSPASPPASAQPLSDLYGLSSGGYGSQTPAPQGYGGSQTAPVQSQPFGLGTGAQAPQHGAGALSSGLPASQVPSQASFAPPQASYAQPSWGAPGEESHLGALAPATQDFGFEAPIDSLGDSFATHGHASSFDQSYADDEAELDDAGGKRSFKKIAFLLGLFVAVGGSLALAYSMLLGPSSSTQTASAPPVIKGDERPTKVKPSDPGGKQFNYTDSKMLGRVGEGGAPQAATGSSSGSGDVDPVTGARKVPLLTVGRDGTIQSNAQPSSAGSQQADAAPAAPGSQTRAVIAVPGMTVIDGIGQGPPLGAPATTASTSPPSPPPQAQPQSQPQQPAQAPKAAQIITASEPPAKPLVVSPPQTEKKTAAQPKKVAVAAVDPTTGATVAQPSTSAAAAPAPSVTGAGYVTVLASVPVSGSSRDVAMRQFQDMQQKYASVLSGKVADVVEANLGEKGTYHRLIAGPPGSKESANQLCNDLKAQGYASCWVTAY